MAADRALGRAVGDDRDLAQAELQRGLGVRHMKHEGRAAEDRRIDKSGRNPEIFGEVEAGGAALRGGAEEAVDILELEPAIVERAADALRHQVDRARLGGDGAEIGFRRPRRSRPSRAGVRSITRPPPRYEDRVWWIIPRRLMDAELDAHADPHLVGGNLLDPAHQPEPLVDIDQRDIVGRTFARMRDRCRIDRAEPGADPPFETVAAGIGADHARVKHRPTGFGAPLVGELAAVEMLLVDRQRRLCNPLHAPSLGGGDCVRLPRRRQGRVDRRGGAAALEGAARQVSEIKVPIRSAGHTRLTGAEINARPNDGSPSAKLKAR